MTDKFARLLGLCANAGKLVSGQEAVKIAVKSGKAFLVAVDGEASENTLKAVKSACSDKIPLVITDRLGEIIGKPERMVLAVTDKKFAGALLRESGL